MGERAAMPRAAAAAAAISAERWCPSRFSRKGFSDSIARRRIDRSKAFPSISFADPKAREALIMAYKVPEFVPEFTLSSRGAAADRYVSGSQWLHSRVEIDGYEEYSGVEYQCAGCSEQYTVLELVCLRIHPTFTRLNPTEVFVAFTSIDGSKQEILPDSGEQAFEGSFRPNGEWMLVDKCADLSLVNRFNLNQVNKCLVHWGSGTVNLELWSEERPVTKETLSRISHEYEVKRSS